MKITKKVLIITYYWPPSGGPGVQRWLKFAKYLPEFGWEPIIYTPENPSYPIIDDSLLNEIPDDLTVIKNKIWEPYQLAEKFSKGNKKFKSGQFDIGTNQSLTSRLSIFIRGNFFIPDARKFWIRPSVKFLTKYLKEHQIDCIVTTGPPHSLHLIGLGLKQNNPALKWIADFRDPWTEISYYKHLKLTTYADQKHRQLEKKVFGTADLCLATSYNDAENFRKAGANSQCITNGFDVDFQPNTKVKNKKFRISYIGVLEQLRNPENFWTALIHLVKNNEEFALNLELVLVGKIDEKIMEYLHTTVLKDKITIKNYLPHSQSFIEMKRADILLLTNFKDAKSKGILPGKIYEYLATENPIVSIGPRHADVQKILQKTNSGKHFTYDDNSSLVDYIVLQFHNWKEQKINNLINIEEVKKFSRYELSKTLAQTLDTL